MGVKGENIMELGDGEADEETLRKELLEERIKSKELLNRLKYAQADLDNYRKRAEKEAADARDSAVKGLVVRLLVVLDELTLAVEHAEAEANGEDLSEGFRMVKKNLESALESVGVERIQAVGKPFDPTLHEAAEKVGPAEGDDVVVVEELRPGYVMKGQVLRPSLVGVGAPNPPKGDKEA
jgi:molecular chaperone GrpE